MMVLGSGSPVLPVRAEKSLWSQKILMFLHIEDSAVNFLKHIQKRRSELGQGSSGVTT